MSREVTAENRRLRAQWEAKEGSKDKKDSNSSPAEKVQFVYGLLVLGLFLLSIFACSFLFRLAFVGFALR